MRCLVFFFSDDIAKVSLKHFLCICALPVETNWVTLSLCFKCRASITVGKRRKQNIFEQVIKLKKNMASCLDSKWNSFVNIIGQDFDLSLHAVEWEHFHFTKCMQRVTPHGRAGRLNNTDPCWCPTKNALLRSTIFPLMILL